jgi:hydroxymethylbilane synthase
VEAPLVIGSRGSDLALWQSRHIQSLLLNRLSIPTRIEIIRTEGDRVIDRPFVEIEGKGFFTKELEDALRDGRIDLAVHSLKDLPTDMAPDLAIAAVPERADPRDLLLIAEPRHDPEAGPLEVAHGARVGTSSVRRRAQLLSLRPDLCVEPLRGNVPTRVRRLREGAYDAILIAQAGVARLGLDLDGLVARPLEVHTLVPAPGQGALAIQVRSSDARVGSIIGQLHDAETAAIVDAERSLLGRFGGGCSLPLGAHIARLHGRHAIFAFYSREDGTDARRVLEESADLSTLPDRAYHGITDTGSNGRGRLAGRRIVVTRQADPIDPLIAGLRELGAEVVSYPTIRIVPDTDPDLEQRALAELDTYDWVLFPSANAVRHFGDRLRAAGRELPRTVRIGVVGPGTAAALAELGREPDLVPEQAISDALLAELLDALEGGAARILIPSARDGRTVLADGLAGAGHDVLTLPVYRTTQPDPHALDPATLAGADYVLFASPSALRHFVEIAGVPTDARVVTIGPVTTSEARKHHVDVFAEARTHTMEGLIECLIED